MDIKTLCGDAVQLRFNETTRIMGAMWIASRYGFYSIACTQKRNGTMDVNTLMIRARVRKHLQNLQSRFESLAEFPVRVTPQNDYRYRLIVPRDLWAKVVLGLVMEQEWSNFKEEAARFGGKNARRYAAALHEVWAIMYRLQQNED